MTQPQDRKCVPGERCSACREVEAVKQIRIRKQGKPNRPQPIDTRTPSGKPLPY